MDFATVDKAYFFIVQNHIDIDVKTLHLAQVTHLKLKKELEIMEFIKSKAHVDDYKTILKSVKILNDMVAEARSLDVDLDASVVQSVNQCTSRLIAERNLRFHMEMSGHVESTHDQVETLTNLLEKAQENNVSAEYMTGADKLSHKMKGAIKAREILQMLLDYPEREYPIEEIVDPKKKKQVKKDDKEKKKKKKKKEPPFPIPEWATEIEEVVLKVENMHSLVADAENLGLDTEFVQRVNGQLQRFKKEINFRKAILEEQRLEAEAKALAKKKAKKK